MFIAPFRCILLVLTVFSSSALQAALVLDFDVASIEGIEFTNATSASPGDTLDIAVYLRGTDATESRLNDLGLASFGFAATYSNEFANVTGVSRNVSDFPLDLASSTGITSSTEFAIAGETFAAAGVRGDAVLLGNFVFEVTGFGDTTFFVRDIDDGFDDFSLTNFVSLDGELFSASGDSASADRSRTYSFTVNAVPEPSAFGVLTIGSLLLAGRRRRPC